MISEVRVVVSAYMARICQHKYRGRVVHVGELNTEYMRSSLFLAQGSPSIYMPSYCFLSSSCSQCYTVSTLSSKQVHHGLIP